MAIRLISNVSAYGVSVDRAPKHVVSKGDVYWEREVLRNQVPQFGRPKNAIVGRDYTKFSVLSQDMAIAQVRVRLPGGTLLAQGRESGKVTSGTIAVVGGTGSFAGARGTAYIGDLGSGRSLNVYRLRLP